MSKHQLPPQQVSMSVSTDVLIGKPSIWVPNGYNLCRYHEKDVQSWLALLHLAGFENWDTQKIREYMGNPVRHVGSRVVVFGDQIMSAPFATPGNNSVEIGIWTTLPLTLTTDARA